MMFNRNGCNVKLSTALLMIILLAIPAKGYGAPAKKKNRILETELQSEMMATADRLASYLYQALRDFEQSGKAPDKRSRVLGDVVLASIAALTIAADPNPGTALLDMVAMVTMGRLIYANHWQRRYGDAFDPMVRAFDKGEHEIWELAAKVLDDAQQRTLRELVVQWHEGSPDHTGFAYLRFGYMASEGSASAADQSKAGGLFKSVAEATRQVEETRLMAERTTYLATRLPLLLGSLGDYWMADLVKNQDIKTLLADIHRLSMTIDRLPEVMAQERSAVIDQSMREINAWSRAAIDQTMRSISKEREQTLRHFFDELKLTRQDTLSELLAEEKAYSKVLAEMRATLNEGNQLLTTANKLVQKLPMPDPNQAASGPAMSVEDYQTILAEIRATIGELNTLAAGLDKAAASPALEKINQLILSSMDQAEKEGAELIDLSFRRALLLILFGVVVLLIAQVLFVYIKKRLLT